MLNSHLFWEFITALSVIIEWGVLKKILDEISEFKGNKLISNIELIAVINIIIIMNLNQLNPNTKLFMDIVISYLFYKFNYDVTPIKCLIIILIYYMILIGFDAIGSSIVVNLNSLDNMNKLLSSNLFRLELIILTKSLLLSLIPIFRSFNLRIKINKQECIYIYIPILANILSIVFIFTLILKDKIISDVESITILVVSSILLLSNFSLISVLCRIIKDNNLRTENKIIKEKIDIQYKYYLNLKDSQLKTRELYHDMKNHMICIKNICKENYLANQYIENINTKLESCNYIFNTNNIILDVILHEKKSICDDNNIEFLVDINFSKCNFIELPDICSIFSNMLDNAIEACNKINDKNILKKIKLRGTLINSFFVIKCENTKINPVVLSNDRIITDKKDSFLHGLGIINIKSSLKKYNGNMEINSSTHKFEMIIYIPLDKKIQLEL
ncbi:two-component signal transduction sensor histidine kinase [[Clostridium] sordellii]|uniref:ATP-binding protein n=1 Tax=Paraclostridium sordellii TaxID=1505 RepID=UPI0005E83C00|nr:ATP-binding protein [Paeniclostridium sordellii]CEP45514.1 two-component signal transduction sensor histidine kinase [[Clostridium] sordellii] [Paeniclostridium sordellii]